MSTAVVAFSGGLDTSFLVPFIREKYGFTHVITCSVDTGGFSAAETARIAARSKELGADEHIAIDACDAFYEEVLKYLIYGNVTRDGYPLCVGSERLVQAREALKLCRARGSQSLVHGCTGAGNDQYRFDLVIHVLGQKGPDGSNAPIKSIAPIREFNVARQTSQAYLRERGFTVPEKSAYSYNVGLWGVSIGGKETLVSDGLIPEDAWYSQADPVLTEREFTLHFVEGEPVQLDHAGDVIRGPVGVIRALAGLAGALGVGRHYQVGTSIPGKKGRFAYESPAADVIYAAHRTLESLTLSQDQIFFKKIVADEFGRLIHEARFFDPLAEDMKAFLASTQKRVTGQARVKLLPGRIASVACKSPNDLLSVEGALYGERTDAYSGQDAAGASYLHSFEQILYHRRG